MDIKLPGISGIETTSLIKAISPAIPIVMQTAHAVDEEKENAYKAGCDDYITKPINPDELLETIDVFLKG